MQGKDRFSLCRRADSCNRLVASLQAKLERTFRQHGDQYLNEKLQDVGANKAGSSGNEDSLTAAWHDFRLSGELQLRTAPREEDSI